MKNSFSPFLSLGLVFFLIFAGCVLSGCSQNQPSAISQQASSLPVQLPQPAEISAAEYSPGLAVIYLDKFYKTIAQMPTVAEAQTLGRKGKPILQLDHKFGKDGLVFDSGKKRGVGMILTGYLHLNQAGTYGFQALANDGVELFLDNQLVLEDPDVHKDRLSPIGIVRVPAAGWYPLTLRYFQRKGTATLKLYWQPPDAAGFSIIPKEVYRHVKGSKQ